MSLLNKLAILSCTILCSASSFAQTKKENKLLDKVQQQSIQYFWDYAEPNSKLARERFHPDGFYPENDSNIVTTGGTGFGLMSLIVGIDREFIPRDEATDRILTGLKFLQKADRFHGAWPHWINGETGKIKPFSAYDNGGDLVETAFLAQGLICLKEYFKNSKNEKEIEISTLADQLWKEIEFNFYTNGKDVLYWHWSPNYEWKINFPLKGFDETLITYIIAASSPNYSISSDVYYKGWARNGAIKSSDSAYGIPLIVKHNGVEKNVGPLFWSQYSFIGLNPNGLVDGIGIDYGKVVKNQAKIHYLYNQSKKETFHHYAKNMWGLTASYSFTADGKDDNTELLRRADVVLTCKLHVGVVAAMFDKSVICAAEHPEKTIRFYSYIGEFGRCSSLYKSEPENILINLKKYENQPMHIDSRVKNLAMKHWDALNLAIRK